ncbi:PREDICTED: uncharacterized protein C1orf167 homolog [Elephantulus edwardii]|uniref:uncharacterized protein C1orf167 homolog n=1 Tax=Elephantulus edwardii TaxID=28737 RepID=UPI0003F09443|nr:PREDICTED: uncharacterized protein C1orf167 homolog [Elephantulus edwardii]
MPCPQTMLHQEPCLIQTNLGSPSLTLEDKTGQRLRSRFLQQSNLQPWSGRRHLKAQSFSFQQSNLSLSKASLAECGDSTGPHLWLESQESFGLHTLPRGSPLCYSRQLTHLSQSQPPDPDFKLPADFSPLDGCPQLGPRASCVLNQWTCRPVGEPLTLDDLTVPAQSQCQAPSHDDGHQLLASMQCLEHKAAQLKCWGSQKPLDPVLWGPWASGGHAVPARPQSSRPAYARLDKTLRGPRSLREKTRGSQNKAPNIVTLETETACWQLLSRCFRAWRKRWQTVVTAERMRRRQLLRRGLRVLRRALHLREARLQAAHARHRKALLARSFREVRGLRVRPEGGILKKKGGWPIPSHPGLRPDGRDERLQILEALQQLTSEMVEKVGVFLLWCHHKSLARQERGVRREVPSALPRIQKVGWCPQASRAPAAAPARVVPLKSQHQRDLLCKCLRTWQGFAQRESRCRDFLTDCRVRTLNTCLRQWVQMKKLHISDGVKVTQLCLWRQKIESSALCSPAPRVSTAWGPRAVTKAQEQLLERSQGSLQKACRRLALHRALLLWRTQLSLHQQANVFLRSLKQRTLQYVLRQWHSSVPRPCTPSHSMKTTWALEPLSSNPTQEALMGCSSHRGSPEKAPRDPALLETLRVTFLRATGRRLQEHSLLLWQTRVQQAWDARSDPPASQEPPCPMMETKKRVTHAGEEGEVLGLLLQSPCPGSEGPCPLGDPSGDLSAGNWAAPAGAQLPE